ncbi:queuine trna-ribosyltransferase [Fusarium heterosporum]|uniref:Queuine trna-ribosyltransferase n=1 Tax=Fusarium heterosporum TaxID=42747 RepID=A0A8H5TNB5_FUSHE|nr:queuine trna-ribosyltransferase [Fusarium heterosporum]
MKSVVLSVLASGAVAQITQGPFAGLDLGLGLGSQNFHVAAINPSDPEYATCQQAVGIVQGCVAAVGGAQAAQTADPQELVACACCDGSSNAAPIYSACSSYLAEEDAQDTSQYEAYGTLYSACKIGARCTGSNSGSGGGGNSVTNSLISKSGSAIGSRPTTSASGFEQETDTPTITTGTSPAEQTYASACLDMLSVFSSCTAANRDFTELPFTEQAECYCCRGSGTRQTWTDSFDKYASTCADWARTGERETAYSVAKTFATFCERFTDVCSNAAARTQESRSVETTDASTTNDSGSRQTGASDDDSDSAATSQQKEGPVTVTVSSSQPAETGNDASSARVGFGAVLAAVAILAVAL